MQVEFYQGLVKYLKSVTPYYIYFGKTKGSKGEYITIKHVAQVDNVCFFGSGSGDTACKYYKIVSQINCWSTADGNYLPSQLSAMDIADEIESNLFNVYFDIEDSRIYGMKINNVSSVSDEVKKVYVYKINCTWWIGTADTDSSSSSESSSSSSSESS